jgi:hypothetical protein
VNTIRRACCLHKCRYINVRVCMKLVGVTEVSHSHSLPPHSRTPSRTHALLLLLPHFHPLLSHFYSYSNTSAPAPPPTPPKIEGGALGPTWDSFRNHTPFSDILGVTTKPSEQYGDHSHMEIRMFRPGFWDLKKLMAVRYIECEY